MRVRCQIATTAHLKEIEQNIRMTRPRVDKNRLRSNEPRPDTRASLTHGEGIIEYFRRIWTEHLGHIAPTNSLSLFA